MTNDLETAVRAALAEQAADAPDGALLLASVHARRRRQTARRRLAILSVAAMTAVVGSGAGLLGVRLANWTSDRATSQTVNALVPVPANWLPAFPLPAGYRPVWGLPEPDTCRMSRSTTCNTPTPKTKPDSRTSSGLCTSGHLTPSCSRCSVESAARS